MGSFKIGKGLDLKLAGAPQTEVTSAPRPQRVGIHPTEFRGVKPKLLCKEGETVKCGQSLFFDKRNPDVHFAAPAGGRIESVNYGPRRIIESIVIKPDWDAADVQFGTRSKSDISKMSREEALKLLLDSGAFVSFRQRPFDKIPDPSRAPKSIFITAMNSAPNAGDPAFMLKERGEELQLGIHLLTKLTDGKVHLCYDPQRDVETFAGLEGAQHHSFAGKHPKGLVGTHIHFVDPIKKGDIVWYLDAWHVYAIGWLLQRGTCCTEKVIALAASGVAQPRYIKTMVGAPLKPIIADSLKQGEMRLIAGTALFGETKSEDDYLPFYESNLQAIPEGRRRHFMGWAMPGFNAYSASSNVFASSLAPGKVWNFDTNLNGGHRTIVWTDVYDQVMPLDIYTNFLVKAILADEVDETEQLGLLEVSDEDFALATYLCPSKVDISAIIRRGLDVIEKEGY
ncbi:MAG: Na(+)-translocating NADH-quinone reductase subunit A [Chitinivibrionales bacterium]|nr:Na(+)-translocating NADH-quinone reductase subunit A [Chitinivibrionales bacterium]